MTLAELHSRYVAERGHTLSTSHLEFGDAVVAQADYVSGEADELVTAARVWAVKGYHAEALRNEIADVILSTVTLAKILGVTAEDCIAEKTAKDKGRG